MSCSCQSSNTLQRVLFYPVTPLDKLEHSLVKKTPYQVGVVGGWKELQWLTGYSGFNAASQTVLAAKAMQIMRKIDRQDIESIAMLAGLKYPALIAVAVDWDLDPVLGEAIANQLTEEALLSHLEATSSAEQL